MFVSCLVGAFFKGVRRIRLVSDGRRVLSTGRQRRGDVPTHLHGSARAYVRRGGYRIDYETPNGRITYMLLISQDVNGSGLAVINQRMTMYRISNSTLFTLHLRTIRRGNMIGIITNVSRTLTITFRYIRLILV